MRLIDIDIPGPHTGITQRGIRTSKTSAIASEEEEEEEEKEEEEEEEASRRRQPTLNGA